jgi:hypothetical protein
MMMQTSPPNKRGDVNCNNQDLEEKSAVMQGFAGSGLSKPVGALTA